MSDQPVICGRCKDCRHWRLLDLRWEGGFDPEDLVDPTHRARFFVGRGECERGETRSGWPEDETTLAFAQDNEHYQAQLITGPEYGCVMFAGKGEGHGGDDGG